MNITQSYTITIPALCMGFVDAIPQIISLAKPSRRTISSLLASHEMAVMSQYRCEFLALAWDEGEGKKGIPGSI